jgi:hypothetical protein
MQFTTAKAAGSTGAFTAAVIHDMGYTNAGTKSSSGPEQPDVNPLLGGTMNQVNAAASSGDIQMVLHGGDISYADDWISGKYSVHTKHENTDRKRYHSLLFFMARMLQRNKLAASSWRLSRCLQGSPPCWGDPNGGFAQRR